MSEPIHNLNTGAVYVALSDGRYLKKIIGGKFLLCGTPAAGAARFVLRLPFNIQQFTHFDSWREIRKHSGKTEVLSSSGTPVWLDVETRQKNQDITTCL